MACPALKKWGAGSPSCSSAIRIRMSKQSYFNSQRPFTLDEFRNPQLAIDRYGIDQALRLYKDFVEPLYVGDRLPGLPRDWEWRKLFVHVRDQAQCQRCRRRRPKVWDAHHVVPRGDGGNHALDNLELLCRFPCHRQEHPRRSGNDAWGRSADPRRMEAF